MQIGVVCTLLSDDYKIFSKIRDVEFYSILHGVKWKKESQKCGGHCSYMT